MFFKYFSTSLILKVSFAVWITTVLHAVFINSYESFNPIKNVIFIFGLILISPLLILHSRNDSDKSFSIFSAVPFILLLCYWLTPSEYVKNSARHSFELALFAGFCLTFFGGCLAAKNYDFKVFILKAIVYNAWLQTLLVFLQRSNLDPFYYFTGSDAEWTVYTTIGNPNHVAAFIIPALFLSQSKQLFKNSHFRLMSLLFMTVATLLTGSRMGTAILFLGVGILNYQKFSNISSFYRSLAIGFTGLFAAFMIKYFMGQGFGLRSVLCRIEYWQTSWELIKTRPIWGYGLGHYEASYIYGAMIRTPHVSILPTNAHNDWLQMAVEGGIIPVLLLVGVIFYSIHSQWFKKDSVKLLPLSLFACFLHACWDSPLQQTANAMLFWLLFGMTLGNISGKIKKPFICIMAFVCLAIVIGNLNLPINRMQAHIAANEARAIALTGDWPGSAQYWQKAYDLDKSEGVFAYWLAQTHLISGDKTKALELLKESSTTHANFDSYILQARLKRHLGDNQQAVFMFQSLLRAFPENERTFTESSRFLNNTVP